ncbi:protein of unknown function [Pseudodesulfovibrio piezophilus C1TLV30]|uniref:Uncharacterized protein n=1 Tax=Pseudodesulfovibrio piezophilus (strain DSM 21447 / JCM 15486 / C1TLV30) TaxID=1322246 RepID=M1WR88_PSEP2|nr:protein of unknown function [Pseudodesulfovibrio piezophilus C1TLV30]
MRTGGQEDISRIKQGIGLFPSLLTLGYTKNIFAINIKILHKKSTWYTGKEQ